MDVDGGSLGFTRAKNVNEEVPDSHLIPGKSEAGSLTHRKDGIVKEQQKMHPRRGDHNVTGHSPSEAQYPVIPEVSKDTNLMP